MLAACAPGSERYDIPLGEGTVRQIREGIEAADASVEVPSGREIRGAIVPHHLTASATIAAGSRMLRGQAARRIVLLSPDHFGKCPTLLCTTTGTFHVAEESVRTDDKAVQTLLWHRIVTHEPMLFRAEHGITAVLPFLIHDLPGVPVVPIVIDTDFRWRGQADALLPALEDIVDSETIVVVSSDFSHYLRLGPADQKDEATAEALFAKDFQGIASLENPAQSDCPACLWLLARIADAQGFYNPSVVRHTNSARILNQPNAAETTSHFAMVFYRNSLLNGGDPAFGGDVTVTRIPEGKAPRLSPELAAFWSGTGSRIVNLEGPLAEDCVQSENPYLFCNRASTWRMIKDLATHWGIMNNHMLDRWREGVPETRRIIRDVGELPVADELLHSPDVRVIALTALMNPVADHLTMHLSAQADRVRRELRAASSETGALLVVLLHGGTEYRALTSAREQEFERGFIDAGADAVMVAHSHVVGDMEIHKGKPIFRGLGNFIFDQFDAVSTSTAKAVRLRKAGGRVLFESHIAR